MEVDGPDAQKFLQGQLTIDMNKLNPLSAKIAAHCNPKGRVIANFITCCIESTHYKLLTLDCIADRLLQALQKYAIFSKVNITMGKPETIIATDVALANSSLSMCLQYPSVTLNWVETSTDAMDNWISYLISNNVVMIDVNTSEKFTPEAIGLNQYGSVAIDKGCYTGQEIIARMHYLGKSKDGLYQARCRSNTLLKTNTPIINSGGAIVGRLLTTIENQPNHHHLLVNLQHQASSKALRLDNNPPLDITVEFSPKQTRPN